MKWMWKSNCAPTLANCCERCATHTAVTPAPIFTSLQLASRAEGLMRRWTKATRSLVHSLASTPGEACPIPLQSGRNANAHGSWYTCSVHVLGGGLRGSTKQFLRKDKVRKEVLEAADRRRSRPVFLCEVKLSRELSDDLDIPRASHHRLQTQQVTHHGKEPGGRTSVGGTFTPRHQVNAELAVPATQQEASSSSPATEKNAI